MAKCRPCCDSPLCQERVEASFSEIAALEDQVRDLAVENNALKKRNEVMVGELQQVKYQVVELETKVEILKENKMSPLEELRMKVHKAMDRRRIEQDALTAKMKLEQLTAQLAKEKAGREELEIALSSASSQLEQVQALHAELLEENDQLREHAHELDIMLHNEREKTEQLQREFDPGGELQLDLQSVFLNSPIHTLGSVMHNLRAKPELSSILDELGEVEHVASELEEPYVKTPARAAFSAWETSTSSQAEKASLAASHVSVEPIADNASHPATSSDHCLSISALEADAQPQMEAVALPEADASPQASAEPLPEAAAEPLPEASALPLPEAEVAEARPPPEADLSEAQPLPACPEETTPSCGHLPISPAAVEEKLRSTEVVPKWQVTQLEFEVLQLRKQMMKMLAENTGSGRGGIDFFGCAAGRGTETVIRDIHFA